MKGVDEVHLLNITVAPGYQGQGWGRVMLDALALWSRAVRARSGCGWKCAPATCGRSRSTSATASAAWASASTTTRPHRGREDAIVMSCKL